MAYTIQPGDTLSQLALTHGTSVQELQKLNPQITDINKIYAGDALNLPVQAPIEQEPPILKVEEPESPIEPAQKILDTITPQTRLEQLEEERQSRVDELEKEKEVVKEERTSLVDKLKDYFVSREPTEDIIRKEMDAFGITKQLEQQRQTFQEITQLQQTATTLIEGRDAAITALGQMAVATPFISGQQARVAESYDRRISTVSALIGAKSAYAEAVAGNINQARAFIGDIVNAYTYDTQLELNRISMFLDLNRDEISMLDTEYQNALNESQRYWENQLAEERAEREAVLNLSLSFLEAGISLDDSLEDALEKTKQWTMIQPDANVRSLMAQYPTAGIKESDSFTQAINKIAKIPGDPEYLSVSEAKALGVPYGTTKRQAMNMGLTPSSEDSLPELSSSQLTKLAERGVPMNVAMTIHEYTLEGYSFDEIFEGMKGSFDPDIAGRYIDIYRDTIRTSGMTQLVDKDATLEIRKKYEPIGIQEILDTEKAEKAKEKPTTQGVRWWDKIIQIVTGK